MRDQKEYTFLVDQWMSIWPGEHIEAVTTAAKPRDEYNWKNVITHNIIYNFQEKHLWLSIFVRLVVLVYYSISMEFSILRLLLVLVISILLFIISIFIIV